MHEQKPKMNLIVFLISILAVVQMFAIFLQITGLMT